MTPPKQEGDVAPPADEGVVAASDKFSDVSTVAKDYYDSDNAFNFYRQVWGGEHIHVGLYTKLEGDDAKLEGVSRITKASSLCTDELLSRCFPEGEDGGSPPPTECTMMDMGSGYGGTARVAAKKFGCKVVCINVASRENEINASLSKEAKLEDKVIIPGEKSFFDTGMPDASCEVVTSQDALLHAGSERHRALGEAARVLKPGGRMVFTDIMQSEHADAKDLQEVYQRIHLDDMGTPDTYAKWGKAHGLEFVEFADFTPNINIHYGSVREVLVSRRDSLDGVEVEFVDNMARGLDAWTSAARRDLIRWGFVVFKKPEKTANPESSKSVVDAISATVQEYYNSDNAFNFYRQVLGGEHIHVGLYTKLEGDDAKLEGVSRITKASSLCTEELLSRCFPAGAAPPPSGCTMLDMGSGYGGTARVAAKELGWKVMCINVSSRENEINASLSKEAKLEDKVIIPGEKSFFDTGMPDASCEVVTSQDALLHASSERHTAFGEAVRVLKPGGRMVFTDIMQSEHADAKDLQEVYQRVHLDDMGTLDTYAKWGKAHGLEFVEFADFTLDLNKHYELVREVLVSRRDSLDGVEVEFVDNMARGLDAWTSAARRGLLRWGFVVFKKPEKTANPESSKSVVDAISATAQGYYDSDNAFNFYRQVWGGEHIHVGLYTKLEGDDAKLEGVSRITKASSLCTEELLSRCFPAGAAPPPSGCTMLDMGSGYGGTARVAAKELGCKVVCINVAARENGVNAALTKAAGLEDKVIIPGEKSFFDTGMPDASCEVVTSQDALLHAGSERHRALAEAARVLKPGGRMVFTDIMQSEHADAKDLQEVYQRIHLDDMGTPKSYAEWGKTHGLEFVEFVDLTANIKIHYGSVREVLVSRRDSLEGVEVEFVDNMARGLDAWTSAAGRDLIRWGFVVLAKPVEKET